MKAKKQPQIYGTGLVALDVVYGLSNGTPRLWAGGTCGNVLTILSFLGWSAFPIARLESDFAAQHVRTDLEKWKVECEFLQLAPRGETPVIIQKIIKRKDGSVVHRFSVTCPECGAWLPSYKPLLISAANQLVEKLSKPQVFFMDRLSRSSLILAQACADRGALVVFEPSSLGDRKFFEEALRIAHVVKYSNERLATFGGLPTKYSVPLEIETLGEDGLRYRANIKNVRTNGWRNIASVPISDLKDAAGAGDWCTAGILHKIGDKGLAGLKRINISQLHEALQFGQVLASWNCRFEGARGGMYSISKTQFDSEIQDLLKGNRIVVGAEHPVHNGFATFQQLCRACKTSRPKGNLQIRGS